MGEERGGVFFELGKKKAEWEEMESGRGKREKKKKYSWAHYPRPVRPAIIGRSDRKGAAGQTGP